MKKISKFLCENIQFLEGKFSICLNRHVFVMLSCNGKDIFLVLSFYL